MENKTIAPKFITRYNLIMTLNKQYNGNSPFIIEKDGRDIYDFKHDRLKFTCCNKTEHKHIKSPLEILQMIYLYGTHPCTICNKNGYINKNKSGIPSGQEDGSSMSENKKYLESDDPSENAKREMEIQNEYRKNNHIHEESYHNKKKTEEVEEEIIESVSYDEYVKNENPEFDENKINVISDNKIESIDPDDDLILPEPEEPIVESESFDSYILKNPEFDKKIIENEEMNKHPASKMDIDYLFNNGNEEVSMYAFGNEEEENEIDENRKRDVEMNHSFMNKSKIEKSNNENANILLNESNKEENNSLSQDDDEEDFIF